MDQSDYNIAKPAPPVSRVAGTVMSLEQPFRRNNHVAGTVSSSLTTISSTSMP